jgi:hypothetical protein
MNYTPLDSAFYYESTLTPNQVKINSYSTICPNCKNQETTTNPFMGDFRTCLRCRKNFKAEKLQSPQTQQQQQQQPQQQQQQHIPFKTIQNTNPNLNANPMQNPFANPLGANPFASNQIPDALFSNNNQYNSFSPLEKEKTKNSRPYL